MGCMNCNECSALMKYFHQSLCVHLWFIALDELYLWFSLNKTSHLTYSVKSKPECSEININNKNTFIYVARFYGNSIGSNTIFFVFLKPTHSILISSLLWELPCIVLVLQRTELNMKWTRLSVLHLLHASFVILNKSLKLSMPHFPRVCLVYFTDRS